jgi:hypothetical protein
MAIEKWEVRQYPRPPHQWGLGRENRDGGLHFINTRTKEEAEAKLAEFAAVGICRECGDVLNDGYMEPHKTEIRTRQTCFECCVWLHYVETGADSTHAVIQGHHYVVKPDKPNAYQGSLGHGGAEFRIRFNDGREIVTHNLWAQGSVPARFRERLPDNAVFLSREESAAYVGSGSANCL